MFAISDPYVKVWLQFGDKRIEKRKTPIFKCTLNPVFNEVFSFNVPWEKIRECSLDVMVMDFDNIGRNELIGRIQLAGISNFLDNISPLENFFENIFRNLNAEVRLLLRIMHFKLCARNLIIVIIN
jgi:Ca2+-dependent lipid-binding protein